MGLFILIYMVVLVLAGVAGVVWFRAATNTRLQSIAEALTQHGAKVLSIEPASSILSTARLRFEHAGQRGRVELAWYGRSAQRMTFAIDAPPRPGMWVRHPGVAGDGLAKTLGYERMFPVGGGTVAVASAASDATITEMLAPAAHDLILKMVDANGFATFVGVGHTIAIGPDGLAIVKLVSLSWPVDVSVAVSIVEQLEALDRLLPRLEASRVIPLKTSLPPPVTAMAPLVAMAVILGPIVLIPHFPIANTDIQAMLAIGLAPAVLGVFVAWRALRGRPSATRELLFATMGVVAIVPFVAMAVLDIANIALDSSPPVLHAVHVLDYYKHNTHTVWVEPWRPGVTREKVIVPKTIAKVSPGDVLEVTTREGAFGWTWTPSITKR